jgi:flagellar assembly factor FliW
MKIQTSRFGAQDIETDSVLYFPDGLLNKPQFKEFKLFHKDDANPVSDDVPVVFWMQSVEDPDTAYSIIDPGMVGFSYEVSLTDEDSQRIEFNTGDEIAIMVIVEETQLAEDAIINSKLTEPLFLNLRSKKGLQRSVKDLEYDIFLNIPVRPEI